MYSRKLTAQQLDDMIRLYEDGKSLRVVGNTFHIDAKTVYRHLLDRKTPIRSVRKLNPLEIPRIIERYCAGESCVKIARDYDVDWSAIYYHVKKEIHITRKMGVRRNICIRCGEQLADDGIYVNYRKAGRWECKICDRERSRLRVREIKLRVIIGYGGKCECCGETIPEFLTIDHINNDGKEHRLTFKASIHLYQYLIKNNFPRECFRLLCMNCNWSRALFGICPHEKLRRDCGINQVASES